MKLSTVKPEHSSMTIAADSDVYLTPEMPDESGRYDTDTGNPVISDQSAKKESEKDYESFQTIPKDLKANFLGGSLFGNNINNKVSEDLDVDLNKIDV